MSEHPHVTVALERLENLAFRVDFKGSGLASLVLDEPSPLGGNQGPNPSRLLAAAVGHCLSVSLLFCLGKSRVPVKDVKTEVSAAIMRNDRGRLRVGRLDVRMVLDLGDVDASGASRCLELFEDFCTVTASIRQGIPVAVEISDPAGRRLFTSGAEKA